MFGFGLVNLHWFDILMFADDMPHNVSGQAGKALKHLKALKLTCGVTFQREFDSLWGNQLFKT